MLDSEVIEGCVDPVLFQAFTRNQSAIHWIRLLRINNGIVEADAEGKGRFVLTGADSRKLNAQILMLVARGMKCQVFLPWIPRLGEVSRVLNKIEAIFVVEIPLFR